MGPNEILILLLVLAIGLAIAAVAINDERIPKVYKRPTLVEEKPILVPQNTQKQPFVTSLDSKLADALGYQSVVTPWNVVGLLTSEDKTDDTILQLEKRTLDPYREWYEYRAVDKHGTVIPLGTGISYLEHGDVIEKITGKESKGKFKVNLYDVNKYVYI